MATEREVILRLKADTEGLEQGLDNVSNELVTINKQLTTIEDDLRNLSKEMGKGEAAKAFNKLNAIVEKNVLSIQDLGVAAASAVCTKIPFLLKAIESSFVPIKIDWAA